MTDAHHLITEQGIATITLNRPTAGNSFDIEAARAMVATLHSLESNDECRALVFRAAGSVFCAGGDVAAVVAASDPAEYFGALVAELSGVSSALARSRLPVVSVLEGAVAGAGLLFPLLSDFVVAVPRTRLVSAYAAVGLTPDCGVSYLLPRSIGERRALRFTLSGLRLDAETALSWGLVDEIAPSDALNERVGAALGGLTGVATQSVAPSRRLVRDLVEFDAHVAKEAAEFVALARSSDTIERLRAFARS